MLLLKHLFRTPQPIPAEHRSNFRHLYLDVLWFGVLNGSTLVFLAVFATRSGANAQQIGLLTAVPAIINLIITLPAGIWIQRFSTRKITCWSAASTRIFYLFFVPLPMLLASQDQVWAVIAITLLMSIPGTVVAVVGNAFFAEAVPPDWRGHVVGTRNAILAASTMVTSLISGQVLDRMPFPSGYQVVFALGFIGAALSCLHIFFVRPIESSPSKSPLTAAVLKAEQSLKPAGLRGLLRFDILTGPFGRVLFLLFLYNFSVFTGQPVFPLYQVRVLYFSDATISLGTSLFWVVHFLGSTQTGALAHRLGNQKMTALGILLTSLSTSIFMVSYHPAIYAVSNVIAGFGWSMIGGGVLNFLLERVPADDRPPYLAWYNLILNAASLTGALLGSQLAAEIGLTGAMLTVVVSRVIAAVAIFRLGSSPSVLKEVSQAP